MLDQETYIARILEDCGLSHANGVSTPLPPGLYLTTDMSPKTDEEREEMKKEIYPTIVGKMMFASNATRPDIAFAVNELAKFMTNYGKKHVAAAKHLLRYLSATRSRGLIFGNTDNPYPLFFQTFVDADFAMSQGRKSVSGYVVLFGGAPICWSAKLQAVVALSSCESEYISVGHGAKQVLWLRSFFSELGIHTTSASIIFCDNDGTVSCTHNPESHSRMKHIDLRYHFIRDLVSRRIVDVVHIPGVENPADLFTKPLPRATHEKWLSMIRLHVDHGEVLRSDEHIGPIVQPRTIALPHSRAY
jgi:hypothetical protein